MDRSKFFNLNWRDVGKGFLVAVVGAVAKFVWESVDAQTLALTTETLWQMLDLGLFAGVGYILKNLFENSDGLLGRREGY